MSYNDNFDEASLLMQTVEAIAVAATEDGNTLSDDLSGALFWGMARMAREARERLEKGREAEHGA